MHYVIVLLCISFFIRAFKKILSFFFQNKFVRDVFKKKLCNFKF